MTTGLRSSSEQRLIPMVAAPVFVIYGWIGAHRPRGVLGGAPYQAAYVVAVVSMFFVSLHLRVIRARTMPGAQRLRRHLWRMCLALFFASASLFIGQPKVFPVSLRGSPLHIALSVAPPVAMISWLIFSRGAPSRLRRLVSTPPFPRVAG